MSAIALSWVATIKVGNQTAKQLLQFYASHNFNKPGFEFKNDTLADQLEVKVRAIQNAHKLLVEKGFLKKEERFAKDGSQLTSIYYLNIPNEFVDNFFNRGGEGVLKTSPPCLKDTPRGVLKTPLNSNINNKQNKRETARKKREPLSASFDFDDDNKQLCKEKKIDEKQTLEKFKAFYKNKNADDWQNKAQLWILREKNTENKSKPNQETRSNVKEYGPGHSTWEANQEWKRKQSHGSEIRRDNAR